MLMSLRYISFYLCFFTAVLLHSTVGILFGIKNILLISTSTRSRDFLPVTSYSFYAMSKGKNDINLTLGQSTFNLAFVVELLEIDVFHDCNEGWLDLGSGPVQGIKLKYQLASGITYECDIMIWPHAAKIWCGVNSGWVRTWYFLQRRWLAFSIRHSFPVRVVDYRFFTATVTPIFGLGSLGSNAKSDKPTEVYLPKLSFGDRRQFAAVCPKDVEVHILKFMTDFIWNLVETFIPGSYCDGPLDTPQLVTDKRQQDAVLQYVEETILNTPPPKEPEIKIRPKSEQKEKDKDKKKATETVKFEIFLSGDTIVSGTGRIVRFRTIGDRPPELGKIMVLISSCNLPAHDDHPVVFVNCGSLTDIPVEELKKNNITQLYLKWTIGDEVHSSEPLPVKNEVNFDDQHAVPLNNDTGSIVLSTFLDDPFKIEIHGTRETILTDDSPIFFGYAKGDRDFGKAIPPSLPNQQLDILLAITKISEQSLSKGANTFIRREYPIFPPDITLMPTERDRICTNDINEVRVPLIPELVIPGYVILKSQMTLDVSMGVVGCKPQKTCQKYSRLYCLLTDSVAVMAVLRHITEINEHLVEVDEIDSLLTGFALDTGDKVMLYVEGPRDGLILSVWDVTEEYYPHLKPVFSTSAKYSCRLYPELLKAAMPFNILKMFVPLSVLLACPPIYARPALPLPTRFAVLKIGRLIASKLLDSPCSSDMPTSRELKSFRLELCVAPRPPPVTLPITNSQKNVAAAIRFNNEQPGAAPGQRINWETKEKKQGN